MLARDRADHCAAMVVLTMCVVKGKTLVLGDLRRTRGISGESEQRSQRRWSRSSLSVRLRNVPLLSVQIYLNILNYVIVFRP